MRQLELDPTLRLPTAGVGAMISREELHTALAQLHRPSTCASAPWASPAAPAAGVDHGRRPATATIEHVGDPVTMDAVHVLHGPPPPLAVVDLVAELADC